MRLEPIATPGNQTLGEKRIDVSRQGLLGLPCIGSGDLRTDLSELALGHRVLVLREIEHQLTPSDSTCRRRLTELLVDVLLPAIVVELHPDET